MVCEIWTTATAMAVVAIFCLGAALRRALRPPFRHHWTPGPTNEPRIRTLTEWNDE